MVLIAKVEETTFHQLYSIVEKRKQTMNNRNARIIVNESHDSKAESIMANAKLIAAAPDLLEALIRAKARIEMDNNPHQSNHCREVVIQIEEAIKKATT